MSFNMPRARRRVAQDNPEILALKVFQPTGGSAPFGQVRYSPGPERTKPGNLWLIETKDGYAFQKEDEHPALGQDAEQRLKTALRNLLTGIARRSISIEVPLIGSGRTGRYLCPFCLRLEPSKAARFRPGEVLEGLTCRGPFGPVSAPQLRIVDDGWLVESYAQGGVCSLMVPGLRLQQYHSPPEFHPLAKRGEQG